MRKDLFMHFGGGIVVAAVILFVLLQGFTAFSAAVILTGAVGVGFELSQKIRNEGSVQIEDALATLLGGIVAVLVIAWASGQLDLKSLSLAPIFFPI